MFPLAGCASQRMKPTDLAISGHSRKQAQDIRSGHMWTVDAKGGSLMSSQCLQLWQRTLLAISADGLYFCLVSKLSQPAHTSASSTVITTIDGVCQISQADVMEQITTVVMIGQLQLLLYSPHFTGQPVSLRSSPAQDQTAREPTSFESGIPWRILTPGYCLASSEMSRQTLTLNCNRFLPDKPKTSSLPCTAAPHFPNHLPLLTSLPPLCQSSPGFFFTSSLARPSHRLPHSHLPLLLIPPSLMGTPAVLDNFKLTQA